MGHRWAVGNYTDSSELKDLVPEVVNISVGHEACHFEHETLDLAYLRTMLQKSIAMDWETMAMHRILS